MTRRKLNWAGFYTVFGVGGVFLASILSYQIITNWEYSLMGYTVIRPGKEYRIHNKYNIDNQKFFVLSREGSFYPTLVDTNTYNNFHINDTIIKLK